MFEYVIFWLRVFFKIYYQQRIIQCYNCNKYDHVAKWCQQTKGLHAGIAARSVYHSHVHTKKPRMITGAVTVTRYTCKMFIDIVNNIYLAN